MSCSSLAADLHFYQFVPSILSLAVANGVESSMECYFVILF